MGEERKRRKKRAAQSACDGAKKFLEDQGGLFPVGSRGSGADNIGLGYEAMTLEWRSNDLKVPGLGFRRQDGGDVAGGTLRASAQQLFDHTKTGLPRCISTSIRERDDDDTRPLTWTG